jgi:hypothetical protein
MMDRFESQYVSAHDRGENVSSRRIRKCPAILLERTTHLKFTTFDKNFQKTNSIKTTILLSVLPLFEPQFSQGFFHISTNFLS